MRQKLITLCPNSFEIAQKKPNFSLWVRNKLLEGSEVVTDDPIFHVYKCPICKTMLEDETRYARNCGLCSYPLKYQGVKA